MKEKSPLSSKDMILACLYTIDTQLHCNWIQQTKLKLKVMQDLESTFWCNVHLWLIQFNIVIQVCVAVTFARYCFLLNTFMADATEEFTCVYSPCNVVIQVCLADTFAQFYLLSFRCVYGWCNRRVYLNDVHAWAHLTSTCIIMFSLTEYVWVPLTCLGELN